MDNSFNSSTDKSISSTWKTADWRTDIVAGFLVFLIALPLSLGVAVASGFPPMAGIISAIIGGLLVSRINGSSLTIVGPAAGLIVVIFASVQNLGSGDMLAGYRYTLAAIVISGLLQIVLGHFKAGRLAVFFPASVVHGMLAAIGIIIMTKQLPVMLGLQVETTGNMLRAILQLLHVQAFFVPKIALIALFALCILIGWPSLQHPVLKKVPAPLLVIMLGIGLGYLFDLQHFHPETLFNLPETININGPFLITMPDNLAASIFFPDFSKVSSASFWESVISICLVGSLETLLSSAAVDKLDPEKRYSDLNKDLQAIGIGNTLSGMIGGLPMIAEIVRSSANIDYGAKSGWSNFWHGGFLLLFVLLFPQIIDSIPLASLAALLVYIGFRLASPQAFAKTLDLGKEQLYIFVVTIVSVLATNLLLGVMLGIAAKLLIHAVRGVPLKNVLSISYHIHHEHDHGYRIKVDGSAIFSNFIALKSELAMLPKGGFIVFDLADVYLIDHTVMEFIHAYKKDYIEHGGRCEVHGLSEHAAASGHRLAARIKQ
ncbi:MAG: SulP family inorganic anion transporter [Methylomonas sp.]|jgi:MFS superfamily sulfate permease-like transporter|uniref:SulP family inorganic anion transporter n=1 Tax=Methylomonas sp. TaxID=418 RepID=UPI0025E06BFA|nr:SulP family inorganic anion transporter [Methylomonas sp.]MCK9605037.1 SulP family inorganic anion transporter [Methylomonas sp.]